VIEIEHLCAHEIFGADGPENHDIAPNSLVTKDTNTAASIKTSIGLRYLEKLVCSSLPVYTTYLVVEASLPDHCDEDGVCLAGNLYSLFGNVAKYTNGNSRLRNVSYAMLSIFSSQKALLGRGPLGACAESGINRGLLRLEKDAC
jgi:hypothetical protein